MHGEDREAIKDDIIGKVEVSIALPISFRERRSIVERKIDKPRLLAFR